MSDHHPNAPSLDGHPDRFIDRHIGPDAVEVGRMLAALGESTLDGLMDRVLPPAIRSDRLDDLPTAGGERECLDRLRTIVERNAVWRSYLGMGYHNCIVPAVIRRNVLENPGWYTSYTPYQAEIAQGRLECLFHFQTMICDLTGLPVSNASLLDEATAAAEAMTMARGLVDRGSRSTLFVDHDCHPQTIDVVRTRAEAMGITIVVGDHRDFRISDDVFAVVVQYPATDGVIHDFADLVRRSHERDALTICICDLLALTLLRAPGTWGADIAVGSSQRFGVPLGFGGPHAAFLATRYEHRRHLPGRLVGRSVDRNGAPAYRLALQTREQHIRREKATSNICTAQALLANLAALYAIYHGPQGLEAIAARTHRLAIVLVAGLRALGYGCGNRPYFDSLRVDVGNDTATGIIATAERYRINLRPLDGRTICIALDETTRPEDIVDLWKIFNGGEDPAFDYDFLATGCEEITIPFDQRRNSPFCRQAIFRRYHSETAMLRLLKSWEEKDLSLTHGMIPLGSCTMKLNPTAAMQPITWHHLADVHPFVPAPQTEGYRRLFHQLERWLTTCTGMAATSLQPNSGAQGEYAGLMCIRAYHRSRGEQHRQVCLIPTSAHGTNPASAIMAGMRVVAVACNDRGDIDLDDLRHKAADHADDLAALMITYPSTHGVFEDGIVTICRIVHEHGGQVYMDGANMNAQVGYTNPGAMGADVCHLNLHKTFAIPHGGGGPGVGPICVARHLSPFLPQHRLGDRLGERLLGPVAAAPWGSAGIMVISWMYLAMMGAAGLRRATQVAILNANYLAARLDPFFPVLYRGHSGLVAHECIIDLRPLKTLSGIDVEDVAKRLMDYGFHAPTVSFPVAGTLMIEPTESENLLELDRFVDAMISIHGEIMDVAEGRADREDNVLKNAPHTAVMVSADVWPFPYSRERAAWPVASLRIRKYWPPVGRIDNVHGDRNLVCCDGSEGSTGLSGDR